MSFRLFGLCAALFFTAGCSRLTGLFHSPDEDAPPPAMAVTAEPAPMPETGTADWCTRVAANARAAAARDGFDAATQERMAQQTLRQCVAMTQG